MSGFGTQDIETKPVFVLELFWMNVFAVDVGLKVLNVCGEKDTDFRTFEKTWFDVY